MKCRSCGTEDLARIIDLGTSPLSNGYITEDGLAASEVWLPLRVQVCLKCWLAQTEDFISETDIFTSEYAYFSSMSESWLQHASRFVDSVVARFNLDHRSHVVEVAANDGYLLRFFQTKGIPCLGIEPTASTAKVARQLGLEILEIFLDESTASDVVEGHTQADLVVGNNVLAHVPDIAGFARALRMLLKPDGILSVEFPSVTTLIDGSQFDTIYHEHFSYLSLTSVAHVFGESGLSVFDVEEIPTHGGSLRVYAQREDHGQRTVEPSVEQRMAYERFRGVNTVPYYMSLQAAADRIKRDLLNFLIDTIESGRSIAGYGAAAKGNTLLNYAGVRPDLLPYVVDRSPGKVGKYLPGSRIPILPVEAIQQHQPDRILVLPWNIADEVVSLLSVGGLKKSDVYRAVPRLEKL